MERPTLAPNVTLVGPMSGTAFQKPQWLVQRGDRYLQVSEILYRVAELADGTRTLEDIAVLVSAATRVEVTPHDVRTLVETRLVPNGIVAGGEGTGIAAARQSSPLAVQLGAALIGPRAIAPFSWLARVFFFPGVVLAALAASIAARMWLYGTHGLSGPIERVIYEPWHAGALAAIAVASAAFHELGHATALRVAGGRARGMGVGFYLIYPVFYTDVTDSYRLGRWRRLLTDLGGFYFNLVFALGVFGAYAVTRADWLLLAVALVDLEVLHQMLPLGRLDGYWILADLAGVPDFFSIAAPFGRRVVGQPSGLPAMRPLANVVVALYLVLIVPAFGLLAYLVARAAPHVAVATLDSFLLQAARFEDARAAQDLASGAGAVSQGVILTLPLFAVTVFLIGIVRWMLRFFLAVAGRSLIQRTASLASVAAAIVLLVALWSPASNAVATGARIAADALPSDRPATFRPIPSPTSLPNVPLPLEQPGPSAPAPSVRTTSAVRTPDALTRPPATPATTPTPAPSASPTATAAPSGASASPSTTPTPGGSR